MPDQDELKIARFPPVGDEKMWVRFGPNGVGADNWQGKRVAEHEHTAENAGDTCDGCGFPYWPD